MLISRHLWRWGLLTCLWALAGLIGFLLSVHVFLMLAIPFGSFQAPGISRVTVVDVVSDFNNRYVDTVTVRSNGGERELSMLKAETEDLRADTEFWVLDNYYYNGMRPSQFRLTPQRLLLEYPEPLLLLAIWGIVRIRRSQARDRKEEVLTGDRKVYRDEFHLRSQRFAAPGPEVDSSSGKAGRD
jgi:hypothetical protein